MMSKPLAALAAIAACASLSACVSASGAITAAGTAAAVEAALKAAGMTVEAYCALAPDGRAEIRARLNLPHLVACANDPPAAAQPMAGSWRAPTLGRIAT